MKKFNKYLYCSTLSCILALQGCITPEPVGPPPRACNASQVLQQRNEQAARSTTDQLDFPQISQYLKAKEQWHFDAGFRLTPGSIQPVQAIAVR